jgi:hypothetical protein
VLPPRALHARLGHWKLGKALPQLTRYDHKCRPRIVTVGAMLCLPRLYWAGCARLLAQMYGERYFDTRGGTDRHWHCHSVFQIRGKRSIEAPLLYCGVIAVSCEAMGVRCLSQQKQQRCKQDY